VTSISYGASHQHAARWSRGKLLGSNAESIIQRERAAQYQHDINLADHKKGACSSSPQKQSKVCALLREPPAKRIGKLKRRTEVKKNRDRKLLIFITDIARLT